MPPSGTSPASGRPRLAKRLGYPTVASYISDRRARGWTWKAIAAESGQPQAWLRRRRCPVSGEGPGDDRLTSRH